MAFKIGEDQEDYSPMVEINVIPLVDVMLVLLIIFMVTAPLSLGGIAVDIPKSKAKGAALDEQKIILSINQAGEFYLDKTAIPPQALEAKLKAVFENREQKDLYIRADRNVAYGRVVDAMSAAKIAGVGKMAMLTKAEGKEGKQ